MTAPELTAPKKPMNRRTVGGAERWSWIFQRVSGVILIVLIFTHLFINLMTGDGVSQIDFAFVAGKWASPLWQWWDFAMLVLAMVHGTNGMRMLVNDYATRPFLRETLHWALRITMIVVIVLGSLVIWTFDPCPVDASGALLEGVPSFCESVV
ncbi:succinate dehydrogenase hydrophobic membrane anchor subunit [Demequina sp. NBRC 110056]|uniref:succinate dehydrogenase hydrophobic membrane anchor subunit n=1 Tax=Demequina sp. NBRC 110056 TaxID=1570345 RepID=UPI000A06E9D6|nr:succinate dehydrogenase hydrophobic membrane anchor subunit [Demequina sp. NBRC 110056]